MVDQSIFSIRSGWLNYAPFNTYQLPRLVRITAREVLGKEQFPAIQGLAGNKHVTVPFVSQAGSVMFTRPLYRLVWPGERDEIEVGTDGVPASILKNIPGHEHVASQGKTPEDGNSLIRMIRDKGSKFPRELPEIFAYHLAVNREHYYPRTDPGEVKVKLQYIDHHVQHPVAALPMTRVDQVLDARFAVDGKYMAALEYLKWHAEGHHQHPMFTGFDTNVRETLMQLSHKSAELYFYLLGDCTYDQTTHYWSRRPRFVWHRLALYLHYVGRTGSGLYAKLSGIDPASGIRTDVVTEHMQDVLDRVDEWRTTLNEKSRRMRHVDYVSTFMTDGGDVQEAL